MSNNEYEKALIILREEGTPKAKHNALVRLSVTTEDMSFKEVLDKAIAGYSYYIKPGYSRQTDTIPRNNREWHEYMLPRKKELMDYCEFVLARGKPQWQILAEQNGWNKMGGGTSNGETD